MIPGFQSREHSASELKDIQYRDVRDFHQWLFSFNFSYGVVRAQNAERYQYNPFKPDYTDLRFNWDSSYGGLQVVIFGLNPPVDQYRHPWVKHQLLRRSQSATLPFKCILETVEIFNTMLLTAFPGIQQQSNIHICEAGFCDPYKKIQDTIYGFTSSPDLHVCTQFAGRWVCEACKQHVSLPHGVKHRGRNAERLKMNKRLRFQIMERDGFACRACGRNSREYGVVLHVDHILAIANGGKTEPDNLHTLCEDCNLGKRDEHVTVMETWNE